ncbi:universal stress protein [Streptomyces lunaelactis]|uniref:universal stress protein n=1 Tax=Streptomyces lunaelactis TaxID=1535768 RepID=UPI001585A80A|nr:universal stress protein [Streptomyces lunaelactis]NUK04147.1 universal stress protein [Streptomyces lunaelactis]NUK06492.1 universal stress protein [Streptomyces lunaelactis]NUK16653.1 universal stress protein [Streptomyces lunaelactis]NUK72929.1 universal stress protein [Streptomyces lunaelactis]NUK81379.1 universal stress protein [Streptomyces lunaelactis]
MTSNVTVGLDGSPESLAAAEWAAREALLRGVPLRLVHAQERPQDLDPASSPEGAQHSQAEGMLNEAADGLRQRHPHLEITTQQLSGLPPDALSIAAKEADLLVLGSRGLGRFAGFLLGSVGLATLRATERPLVVVRAPSGREDVPQSDSPAAGAPGPYLDVVVGVDLQQACDAVISFAFDAAARRACTIRVVHGWTPPLVYTRIAAVESGEQYAQALSDMLIPWRQKFPSVRVVEDAVFGAAAQQLVWASADAELVVVGRRIQQAPHSGHIGPVTHAVLHHSTAPVAVVAHD